MSGPTTPIGAQIPPSSISIQQQARDLQTKAVEDAIALWDLHIQVSGSSLEKAIACARPEYSLRIFVLELQNFKNNQMLPTAAEEGLRKSLIGKLKSIRPDQISNFNNDSIQNRLREGSKISQKATELRETPRSKLLLAAGQLERIAKEYEKQTEKAKVEMGKDFFGIVTLSIENVSTYVKNHANYDLAMFKKNFLLGIAQRPPEGLAQLKDFSFDTVFAFASGEERGQLDRLNEWKNFADRYDIFLKKNLVDGDEYNNWAEGTKCVCAMKEIYTDKDGHSIQHYIPTQEAIKPSPRTVI